MRSKRPLISSHRPLCPRSLSLWHPKQEPAKSTPDNSPVVQSMAANTVVRVEITWCNCICQNDAWQLYGTDRRLPMVARGYDSFNVLGPWVALCPCPAGVATALVHVQGWSQTGLLCPPRLPLPLQPGTGKDLSLVTPECSLGLWVLRGWSSGPSVHVTFLPEL